MFQRNQYRKNGSETVEFRATFAALQSRAPTGAVEGRVGKRLVATGRTGHGQRIVSREKLKD